MNQKELLFHRVIDRVIATSNTRLKSYIYGSSDELIIALPATILILINNNGKPVKYRGIHIIPGYENAIVFYHPLYWLYEQDWMVHKYSLLPGFKTKDEGIEKMILDLRGISDLTGRSVDPINN